ncbi:hypothetical protein TNCT_483041 [Trichonephila clavata]|uniref:Uncharacterized protein n=1 Tax=Trichonephila clavata TaxID=2740835 RepID=A0A8X6HHK5_TRICU|nr:hypothetical protein TNCT_483041 [Trichonephila clavata]
MAESTQNAIPNQKNSQKHVVIIPIDVHHCHDSQVSRILDLVKASDITKAQQKNLEGKKTPAERMRDYSARKKVHIQSTRDSSSVVHHQVDEILQADDNLNKSHEFVGISCQDTNAARKRTPAERMRKYRARKKVRIQSTSDSPSVVHHQENENSLADDNLNSSHEFVGLPCQDINAIRRKTSAERMREYKRRRINVVESELVQEPQHQC